MSASTSNLPPLPSSSPAPGWKDEVSARVRAHRSRRVPQNQPALPGMEAAAAPSAIAAKVAERYARIPSWREAMAAEAAAQAAQAAAPQKPAAPRRTRSLPRNAAPKTDPAFDLYPDDPSLPDLSPSAPSPSDPRPAPRSSAHAAPARRAADPEPQPYQPDLIRYSVSSDSLPAPRFTPEEARAHPAPHLFVEEVFDPLEEAIIEPTRLLPARVIEFPRELVAPRKARPRLAEGPLCEEPASANPQAPQRAGDSPRAAVLSGSGALRILEAEPESTPQTPSTSDSVRQSVPEWQSIHLDNEEPVREAKTAPTSSLLDDLPLHVAPIEARLMAGVVDIALTLAAFLVFLLVFAACTTHPPVGRTALIGAAVTLLAMGLLYQFIFFSLSAATPGMRYAKIALCTFDDENPSRRLMRARIAAILLSALPLGLGFLWAAFDEDYLSWHDRITQTYQRSYRE